MAGCFSITQVSICSTFRDNTLAYDAFTVPQDRSQHKHLTLDADLFSRPFSLKPLPSLEGLLLATGLAGSSKLWSPDNMTSSEAKGDPGPAVADTMAATVSAYALSPAARAKISAIPHRQPSTAALLIALQYTSVRKPSRMLLPVRAYNGHEEELRRQSYQSWARQRAGGSASKVRHVPSAPESFSLLALQEQLLHMPSCAGVCGAMGAAVPLQCCCTGAMRLPCRHQGCSTATWRGQHSCQLRLCRPQSKRDCRCIRILQPLARVMCQDRDADQGNQSATKLGNEK